MQLDWRFSSDPGQRTDTIVIIRLARDNRTLRSTLDVYPCTHCTKYRYCYNLLKGDLFRATRRAAGKSLERNKSLGIVRTSFGRDKGDRNGSAFIRVRLEFRFRSGNRVFVILRRYT